MKIDIPGYHKLNLKHVVMDFNGTLAVDGRLIPGVREAFKVLSEDMTLHVLTADTFGLAADELEGTPCKLSILPKDDQARGKREYVNHLGAEKTAAIGNGRNDRMMLKASALGICVTIEEGACVETLLAADIVCPSIISALELLMNPLRLTATLRS